MSSTLWMPLLLIHGRHLKSLPARFLVMLDKDSRLVSPSSLPQSLSFCFMRVSFLSLWNFLHETVTAGVQDGQWRVPSVLQPGRNGEPRRKALDSLFWSEEVLAGLPHGWCFPSPVIWPFWFRCGDFWTCARRKKADSPPDSALD